MAKLLFVSLAVSLALCPWFKASADDAKPAADNSELVAADRLYQSGKFSEAAEKYQSILKADAKLVPAQTGLIDSLLRDQRVDESYAVASSALSAQPHSAPLLAAMGNVQFRRAEMSQAETSYINALAVDPKEVAAYVGLASLYRAYSLYRHSYDALVRAHQIAPNNPAVERLWLRQLPRRDRIAALQAYLAGPHPDDPEVTQSLHHYLDFLMATVNEPVHACKLVNKIEQTDTKLEAMYRDPNHINGYALAVKLNGRNSHLLVDTGASGILIGRKFAEKAGLTRISEIKVSGVGDKGLQGGYVALAADIRIGELEFEDCVVHVTDRTPMADEDGLIGADVFGSYLIDIDIPEQKLRLSPLPKRPDETTAGTALDSEGESPSNPEDKAENSSDQNAGSAAGANKAANTAPTPRLPKDRYVAPAMADWTPVFRFGHELLIRTRVNDSQPMLFLIDTGASVNLLSTKAARQVTKIDSDTRTHVKGISGSVANVYRAEQATLVFGHFSQKNQNIVSFDLSKISHNTGTEVSGVLGFELLRMLQIKIDYRDGLVDFRYDPHWSSAR
jgi:predicted aspartyl protease